MGFPQPCWLPSLGEADPGQPPELCLRTPGLRDPRLGGASACGQGPARQGGVAPPLSARPRPAQLRAVEEQRPLPAPSGDAQPGELELLEAEGRVA